MNQSPTLTTMLPTSKTASCLTVVTPRTLSLQRKERADLSLLSASVSPEQFT